MYPPPRAGYANSVRCPQMICPFLTSHVRLINLIAFFPIASVSAYRVASASAPQATHRQTRRPRVKLQSIGVSRVSRPFALDFDAGAAGPVIFQLRLKREGWVHLGFKRLGMNVIGRWFRWLFFLFHIHLKAQCGSSRISSSSFCVGGLAFGFSMRILAAHEPHNHSEPPCLQTNGRTPASGGSIIGMFGSATTSPNALRSLLGPLVLHVKGIPFISSGCCGSAVKDRTQTSIARHATKTRSRSNS